MIARPKRSTISADREPIARQPLCVAPSGSPRAEVLSDQRRGGDREAEADQEREREDADADAVGGVAARCRRATRSRGRRGSRPARRPARGRPGSRCRSSGARACAPRSRRPARPERAAMPRNQSVTSASAPTAERDAARDRRRRRRRARAGRSARTRARRRSTTLTTLVSAPIRERRARVACRAQRGADHEAAPRRRSWNRLIQRMKIAASSIVSALEPEDARETVRRRRSPAALTASAMIAQSPSETARHALGLLAVARAPGARHQRGGAGRHRHQHAPAGRRRCGCRSSTAATAGGAERAHDLDVDEADHRLQQVGERSPARRAARFRSPGRGRARWTSASVSGFARDHPGADPRGRVDCPRRASSGRVAVADDGRDVPARRAEARIGSSDDTAGCRRRGSGWPAAVGHAEPEALLPRASRARRRRGRGR